jgi:hypothetical protein
VRRMPKKRGSAPAKQLGLQRQREEVDCAWDVGERSDEYVSYKAQVLRK